MNGVALAHMGLRLVVVVIADRNYSTAFSGRTGNSLYSWAASVLWAPCVDSPRRLITLAMVGLP
jgi:hypothetical protein